MKAISVLARFHFAKHTSTERQAERQRQSADGNMASDFTPTAVCADDYFEHMNKKNFKKLQKRSDTSNEYKTFLLIRRTNASNTRVYFTDAIVFALCSILEQLTGTNRLIATDSL